MRKELGKGEDQPKIKVVRLRSNEMIYSEMTVDEFIECQNRSIVNDITKMMLKGKDGSEISNAIDEAGWCESEEDKKILIQEAQKLVERTKPYQN